MFEALLVQQATTYRRATGPASTDRFGQVLEPTEDKPYNSFPCRSSRGSGGETMGERSRDVYEESYNVYCLPSVDVREDDMLSVKDRFGNEVVPQGQIMQIKKVYDGAGDVHHLELRVWVQRGPR